MPHMQLHNFLTTQLETTHIKRALQISLFDMRRASDSVDHEALIRTLTNTTGFIQWCSKYPQHQQQKVIIEHITSPLINTTSGVLQEKN